MAAGPRTSLCAFKSRTNVDRWRVVGIAGESHLIAAQGGKSAQPPQAHLFHKFQTARAQLQGIPVTLQDDIPSNRHDEYKQDYVENIGIDLNQVIVFGNGKNDRLWLKAVRDAGGLAIAVDVGEGCAMDAMTNANLFVFRIVKALDLLLDEKRLVGTLRTE